MTDNNLINQLKDEMNKTLEHLKTLFKGVSAGRADPDLLNTIRVDCYGNKMPITQVAVISIADAMTLQVQPFDPSNVHEIAKALGSSNLGFQVQKAKTSILVKIPQLTGESRKRLSNHVKDLTEKQKIALRHIRNSIRKQLKAEDLPKDEKKDLEKQVDSLSKTYGEKLQDLLDTKQQELLTK